MVTKFDHNLVMDGKPSTKVTLHLLSRCMSTNLSRYSSRGAMVIWLWVIDHSFSHYLWH